MNTVELWHEISRGREMDRLEEVLAENCVFMSPVVHTPQKGRELTRAYLPPLSACSMTVFAM